MWPVKSIERLAQCERLRYYLDWIEMASGAADYQRPVIEQAPHDGLLYGDAFELPGTDLHYPTVNKTAFNCEAARCYRNLGGDPLDPGGDKRRRAKNKQGRSVKCCGATVRKAEYEQQIPENDYQDWAGIDNPVQAPGAQHVLVRNKRAFDVFHLIPRQFRTTSKLVSKGLMLQRALDPARIVGPRNDRARRWLLCVDDVGRHLHRDARKPVGRVLCLALLLVCRAVFRRHLLQHRAGRRRYRRARRRPADGRRGAQAGA